MTEDWMLISVLVLVLVVFNFFLRKLPILLNSKAKKNAKTGRFCPLTDNIEESTKHAKEFNERAV
jgi:hypothetical protein